MDRRMYERATSSEVLWGAVVVALFGLLGVWVVGA